MNGRPRSVQDSLGDLLRSAPALELEAGSEFRSRSPPPFRPDIRLRGVLRRMFVAGTDVDVGPRQVEAIE
jgi:hypothetical protein